MTRIHRITLLASLALVLTNCNERQQSTAPLAAVAQAALLDAIAPQGAAQDDQPISATSLTLPFSGSYNGIPAAFEISQTGLGRAGVFQNTSSTNPRVALTVQTAGTSNALYARSYGTGVTAWVENTNPNNKSDVLRLENDGLGVLLHAVSTRGQAVLAENSGTSGAGFFTISNTSNAAHVLTAYNTGSGASLSATTTGTGFAGILAINNPNNAKPALWAYTGGTSHAGMFQSTNPNNSTPALWVETQGTGAALLTDQQGSSGDIALFRTDAVNQARIDRNGRGFFNGGTQNNGADVAEAFEVDGRVTDYRPGDVLVISTRGNRRVSLSDEAYSSRVIGVYATKPGVLLTERGIDDSLADMIPVGVLGVVPTRVSAENGAIRRGDILVSAATPGHAMRTDPVEVKGIKLYPSGAIVGKALENFAGPGTGVIKVLVNVK